TMTDEYSGGMWWRKLCPKPVGSLPLHVEVDGLDLSNQSMISAQGLADTVTPPEGITCYTEGVTMTLSGPDLVVQGDRKPLINITSYYDPDQEWTIFYVLV
ncbi:MAG: hypothetical protein JW736_03965, partial [Deltaproteobacteria bacterium]|nr:hypothetical protein [Deltaproteobacteria bacterium]